MINARQGLCIVCQRMERKHIHDLSTRTTAASSVLVNSSLSNSYIPFLVTGLPKHLQGEHPFAEYFDNMNLAVESVTVCRRVGSLKNLIDLRTLRLLEKAWDEEYDPETSADRCRALYGCPILTSDLMIATANRSSSSTCSKSISTYYLPSSWTSRNCVGKHDTLNVCHLSP